MNNRERSRVSLVRRSAGRLSDGTALVEGANLTKGDFKCSGIASRPAERRPACFGCGADHSRLGRFGGGGQHETHYHHGAVEAKGGTIVDKEPFPSAALPEGKGYELEAPNAEGRWEVSTYRWEPNQIIVNQGDEVMLEILGVNGAEHDRRLRS